jgi:hypothetical protein
LNWLRAPTRLGDISAKVAELQPYYGKGFATPASGIW